jgi:murein DD-endopeptidase MepM/ murein hydrolase activator NlpD
MKKLLYAFITLVICALAFFVGLNKNMVGDPTEAYQIYLNGNKIGLINSKNKLLKLIDKNQEDIKKEYKVDKVYPPEGLSIEKVYTYDATLSKEKDIYNQIEDKDPFMIEGYTVTINYNGNVIRGEEEYQEGEKNKTDETPPAYVYILDRKMIDEALYNTAVAFIGEENLTSYENGTQTEITDVGEIITSVFFEETITVKKSLISTKEKIFTNTADLTQYLMYGTNDQHATYTVKPGEDLETIADNNHLNIEELLIANPSYPSANVLLTAGEKLNVSLINPLINLSYKKTIISDEVKKFKQTEVKDPNQYIDYRKVTTKGEDGLSRVTYDVKITNGEIKAYLPVKEEVLREPINEVTTIGTKQYPSMGNYNYVNVGNDSYSWPTVSPSIVYSAFKYRWGKMHNGIDIAGIPHGSPIYAVKEGIVVETGSHYSLGLYVYVDHGNGVITQYMHMSKILVKEGQHVSKEQVVGRAGCTGSCTGTHLHLGVVVNGYPYKGGTFLNPCASIFKCKEKQVL